MKLNSTLQKYFAAALLLVSMAAFLAASALLLVAVYLLGVELIGQGELHSFCPANSVSNKCANRWWAPMVGSLVLILMGGVLWSVGVKKWRG